MKDIEKFLSLMRPVDAPVELRRKILTQIDASSLDASQSFWDLFLEDWRGWTARIWVSLPCMIAALWIFAATQNRDLPFSSTNDRPFDFVTFYSAIAEQQKILMLLDDECGRQSKQKTIQTLELFYNTPPQTRSAKRPLELYQYV